MPSATTCNVTSFQLTDSSAPWMKRTPAASAAARASARPLVSSWSVSAQTSTPRAAARSATAAGCQQAVGMTWNGCAGRSVAWNGAVRLDIGADRPHSINIDDSEVLAANPMSRRGNRAPVRMPFGGFWPPPAGYPCATEGFDQQLCQCLSGRPRLFIVSAKRSMLCDVTN